LVAWDPGAELLLPDAVVNLCSRLGGELRLAEIGFEKNELDEWALQPLRRE
jgi:hypothetical protein